MEINLNPTGNIFERLFAAGYLLFFPRRFLTGLFTYWHDLCLSIAAEEANG